MCKDYVFFITSVVASATPLPPWQRGSNGNVVRITFGPGGSLSWRTVSFEPKQAPVPKVRCPIRDGHRGIPDADLRAVPVPVPSIRKSLRCGWSTSSDTVPVRVHISLSKLEQTTRTRYISKQLPGYRYRVRVPVPRCRKLK